MLDLALPAPHSTVARYSLIFLATSLDVVKL